MRWIWTFVNGRISAQPRQGVPEQAVRGTLTAAGQGPAWDFRLRERRHRLKQGIMTDQELIYAPGRIDQIPYSTPIPGPSIFLLQTQNGPVLLAGLRLLVAQRYRQY